jgi:hypothetical protein
MNRVSLAASQTEERSGLRFLLLVLKGEMLGETADWLTIDTHALRLAKICYYLSRI